MEIYSFKLENFEGPLDLLLHLIEKHKIDIYDIPIVAITSQYMAYLENWNYFDIAYSSEFLVMAATLLHIKSRMLLPTKINEDIEEDPRDELVARLIELKKIKAYADILDERVEENSNIFARNEALSECGIKASYDLSNVPFYKIFYNALNRLDEQEEIVPTVIVEKDEFTVEDATRLVLRELLQNKVLHYERFIYKFTDKHKLVTVFLAILELLKIQLIELEQDAYDEVLLREVL